MNAAEQSAGPSLFGRPVRHVHCIGAGGMGVAPLAMYLSQLGFSVTGEDDAMPEEIRELLSRAEIAVGPLPECCDVVVHSSAITPAHPARVAATARGLSQVRRGEMLAEIVRGKRLVAVCGSHGKTTTTAMLVTALQRARFPAGYVLGGLFADGTSPARVGANDWVVAEIDESDGTIAGFSPEITVAVNLDWDHPDQYRQLADFERTFAALFARTRGAVLVGESCVVTERIRTAEAGDRSRFVTFGRAGDFRFGVVEETAARMELGLSGRFEIERASVRARGDFNASNATAALAAAQLMGAAPTRQSLADFPGVRRRQAVLHDADGVTVIEDYAHHPGEIHALLGSLRSQAAGRGGRLLVIFQPHRFTRTAQFKREFAASLAAADALWLFDVYGAGERPVAGGSTADLLAELQRAAPGLPVHHETADDTIMFATLGNDVRAGDLIAIVGAGDIDRKARAWLEKWRTK